MIEDTGWFFDTELLVLTQRADLRFTKYRWTGLTIRIHGSTSWQLLQRMSEASCDWVLR